MKRRIILSIALAMSFAILSLIKSDSSVQAEPSQRFVSDTGIITLGSTQSLVITVARSAQNDSTPPVEHILQFRRITYANDVCNGAVCKQTVASSTNSGAIPLMPGESATFRVG